MIQKLLQSLAVAALVLVPVLAQPGAVYAACPTGGDSKSQVLKGVGQGGGDCSDKQVTDTVKAAVSILSYIAGIAAIIMVVYAGFKYTTSAGDSNKVGSAKTTLIYALVGVVVAGLAQLLVKIVLSESSK